MNCKDKGDRTIPEMFAYAVSHHADKTAAIDGEQCISYRELLPVQEGLSGRLSEDCQILAGQKVVLFLPNSPEFILHFFALNRIGAVVIPLNTGLVEHELLYYVKKCGIHAVVTSRSLIGRWGAIPLQGRVRFILADQWENSSSHVTLSQSSKSLTDISAISPDEEVLYLSTSGSTGNPRIVARTHAQLLAGAGNVGRALEITHRDRFLSVTPFFHANGFSNCMLLPIMCGAAVVLMRQFSPRQALSLLKERDITVLFGSPFIFSTLADVAESQYSLPSLRLCVSTGSPMPRDLGKSFYEKFGIKVRQLYGSSETGTISIASGDDTAEDSVGAPLGGVGLRIADENGIELPPLHSGEILVKSPAMMKRYVNEPNLSSDVFCDGYFRTGDLGMLDVCGTLHLSGRKKRFINISGIKVDPVEIENALLSFHRIREARVVGVHNRRGMEMLKAVIVAEEGCTLKEVVAYCRDRLADFKIPRIIEFTKKLPQDILGKVSGNDLAGTPEEE